MTLKQDRLKRLTPQKAATKTKGGFPLIKEAIGFGATVEEAQENALKELNASEMDDVQFEIVSMPKKKVLGIFGGSKAEVKATLEVADKKPKPSKKPAAKKEKNEVKSEVKAEVKKTEKPVKAEKPAEEKIEPAKDKVDDGYSPAVGMDEIPADSPAGKAAAYLKTIIASLNCGEVDIKVALKENGALLLLNGDDLSIIIGRRGETLDAVQYLASLAANNGGGHYKVSINVGDYREKREETLTNLAKRVSAQALKAGKCRTLEPMNPYERRIIHTAVQNIEGVVSGSFGEGSNRRVVIAPEGVELRPRRDDRRRSGGRSHSHGGSRPKTSVVESASREPKRDSDIPLYGKIN